MSRSQRVEDATSEFSRWRAAQQLEQRARPVSLFDQPAPPESEDSRRAAQEPAIRSVATNAGSAWARHASSAIRSAAHQHRELTVDDVWPFITEQVHDSRALGAAMLQAARAGFIERVPGAFRTSERPETHSRPLALWRSRIYGRAA